MPQILIQPIGKSKFYYKKASINLNFVLKTKKTSLVFHLPKTGAGATKMLARAPDKILNRLRLQQKTAAQIGSCSTTLEIKQFNFFRSHPSASDERNLCNGCDGAREVMPPPLRPHPLRRLPLELLHLGLCASAKAPCTSPRGLCASATGP